MSCSTSISALPLFKCSQIHALPTVSSVPLCFLIDNISNLEIQISFLDEKPIILPLQSLMAAPVLPILLLLSNIELDSTLAAFPLSKVKQAPGLVPPPPLAVLLLLIKDDPHLILPFFNFWTPQVSEVMFHVLSTSQGACSFRIKLAPQHCSYLCTLNSAKSLTASIYNHYQPFNPSHHTSPYPTHLT